MDKPKYRVLIADDHPLARKAIRSILQGDESFTVIGEASDGKEAIAHCTDLLPDLILMDINMPHLNGLEATKHIKRLFPHIKIVLLTVSDDVADLFTAIQFGAQGYLVKNMDPHDWVAYLHALLDEDSEVSRKLADRLFHQFRTKHDQDLPDLGLLTTREQEILVHVATGDTNRKIAEKLMITENTVKNHIKNMLEKLSLENRIQLTSYAIRNGLTDTILKNEKG